MVNKYSIDKKIYDLFIYYIGSMMIIISYLLIKKSQISVMYYNQL